MNISIRKAVLALTEKEYTLLFLIIDKYKKGDSLIIKSQEFNNLLGGGLNKNDLYETIKLLFMRQFSLTGGLANCRWIQYFDYYDLSKYESEVTIFLVDIINQYLDEIFEMLKSAITNSSYNFKNLYSKQLFIILSNFIKTKETEKYSVDLLRKLLSINPSEYKTMGVLKRFVLDLAVAEINEKTPYQVEYNQFKQGRNISHFQFTIISKLELQQRINGVPTIRITEKQVAYFSSVLVQNKTVHSILPPNIGEPRNEYQDRIADQLRNPKLIMKYLDVLNELELKI